jgi:hypothetical protein
VDETTRPIVTGKAVELGKQPGFGRIKVGFIGKREQRALKGVGIAPHPMAAGPRTHNRWKRRHQHRDARETIDPNVEDRNFDTPRRRCLIQRVCYLAAHFARGGQHPDVQVGVRISSLLYLCD